jgi:uncharacterized protein YodC (DUF2158 family)
LTIAHGIPHHGAILEFKIGNLVQLKSGGPTMTITSKDNYDARGEEEVACTWYVGGERNKESFDPETLKAAGPVD